VLLSSSLLDILLGAFNLGLVLTLILSLVAAAIIIPILKVASGRSTVSEIYEKQKKKRDRRAARRETRTKLNTAKDYFNANPNMTRKEKADYMRKNNILFLRRD